MSSGPGRHGVRPAGRNPWPCRVYPDINQRIRARCDIVINNSTGGGVHGDMIGQLPDGSWEILWEERLKGMPATPAEAREIMGLPRQGAVRPEFAPP